MKLGGWSGVTTGDEEGLKVPFLLMDALLFHPLASASLSVKRVPLP